jgi:intracellular septation protein A
MTFVLDLAPLLLFFGAYAVFGIYPATAVLIVSLFLLVGIYWLREHRLHRMHLVTAVVALVFGGLTIYLHNPEFIKLKPTIIYGLMAVVLGGSQMFGHRVLMSRIPASMIDLPAPVWRRVNLAWTLFFAFCALLNIYIAHFFSMRVWVGFHTFGFTAMTFVFLLAHAPFLARYLPHDERPG